MNLEDALSEHLKKQIDKVMPYLAKKIVHELKGGMATSNDELWSTAEIAEYTGIHKQKIYLLTNNPSFPDSIVLPKHTADNFSARWYAKDVKSWVSDHKKRNLRMH